MWHSTSNEILPDELSYAYGSGPTISGNIFPRLLQYVLTPVNRKALRRPSWCRGPKGTHQDGTGHQAKVIRLFTDNHSLLLRLSNFRNNLFMSSCVPWPPWWHFPSCYHQFVPQPFYSMSCKPAATVTLDCANLMMAPLLFTLFPTMFWAGVKNDSLSHRRCTRTMAPQYSSIQT